jgi:hypothetical protein
MFVDRVPRRRITLLSGIGALLAIFSSLATLLDTRLYDEALPPALLIGTLGFDAMTLLVAGGVLVSLVAIERGAERFWLLWLGLQGYLLYAYSLYAFGLVFTSLFLVYLAIMGLSAYALAGFALSFDHSALNRWSLPRLPRRTMGVALVGIAFAFAVLWVATLLGFVGQDLPEAAAIVLVLDLAFTLPLLVIVGVMLFRGRPLGDFLAPGIFAMAASIALGVAAGEFIRPVYGEGFSVWLAAPYLVPGLICAGFAFVAFRRVGARMPTASS